MTPIPFTSHSPFPSTAFRISAAQLQHMARSEASAAVAALQQAAAVELTGSAAQPLQQPVSLRILQCVATTDN